MGKLLKIYTYVDGVNDTPFPNADAQIEIFRFNYDAKRMGGAPTISASVMYKDCLDKLWTGKEYVIYNGERYKLKQTPTSSKNNTDARYKHDLELVALRVVLDYVYFFDAVVENTPVDDKPVTNSTKVVFSGDIHEFAKRLNASLKYTELDYSVVVDDGITSETKFLSFDAQPISSVLQEIYKQYEIPYYFVGNVIHIGFTSNAITKTFKYGANDALLSISKNNANNKIVNRCTGVGSEENIPYYYPNEHPLGIVDTYYTPDGGDKTLRNDLVVNKNKFAEKVKNATEFSYKVVETNNEFSPVISVYQISSFWEMQRNSIKYANDMGYTDNTSAYQIIKQCMPTWLTSNDCWFWFPFASIEDSIIYNDTVVTLLTKYSPEEVGLCIYKKINKLSEPLWFTKNNNTDNAIIIKIDRELYKGQTLTPTISFSSSPPRSMHVNYFILAYNKNGLITSKSVDVINVDEMIDDYAVCVCSCNGGYAETMNRFIDITIKTSSPITRTDWVDKNDSIIYLYEYGIKYNNEPNIGDKITFQTREGSLIPYQDTLMPPIYWQTKGAESFYNAINDTYISPETGKNYSFENEYSDENRREHKETFDYIKPSIEFVRNGDTLPINMFLEFAYDENDSDEIDELTNEYIHPYFFAKLRKFNGENGFNLFDHANEKGEMTISMTSGNCGACNFVIGVSENTKKNIVQVDDSGNLVYESGRVKFGAPQDKQNDTINNEVWIALKKDTQTFGMLLPNKSIYPKPCTSADTNDGDTFIITNISLPTSFIREAEERLKEEIIKYMKLNNSEKFTFSIKFSRIYLAENPNILAQLNENARIQIEYNGTTYELYVSSYQYKVSNNEVLPEITVELADTLTQSENALQQAINAVEHSIMSSVGSIDFYKQGLKYFVRKDVEDYVRGLLHLTKGATFGANDIAKVDEQGNADFVSQIIRQYISTPQFIDGFAGAGFKLWLDENGKSNLTIDNITARETFRVFEMLVTKLRAVNGGLFVSAANGTIKEVVDSGEYYDIILEDDNTFVAGDYMRCQVMSGLKTMDYWVEVYSVNGKTCRVLKSEFGDVMPLVGQDVVLDGSRHPKRQNAIHISATEDGQPRIDILDGIKTKSHEGCLRTRLGNLDGLYDESFGENQPHGDGLYSDNAFLKGEFIVKSTGESVDTMFAVQDGKIQSAVKQTQSESIKGKTLLYNASFTEGLNGWITSNEATTLYDEVSGLWFSDNSLLAQNVSIFSDPTFENVFFLNINGGWIKQHAYRFVDKPEFDNTKQYPLFFSCNVRCKYRGVLNVYMTGISSQYATTFKGVSQQSYEDSQWILVEVSDKQTYALQVSEEGYIEAGDEIAVKICNNGEPLLYNLTRGYEYPLLDWRDEQMGTSEEHLTEAISIIHLGYLEPTSDFVSVNIDGNLWNGTGDFYLSFGGEADFYGITIYTEKTEVRHQTLFEQTDKLVRFASERIGEDGNILNGAVVRVETEGDKSGTYLDVVYQKDGKSERQTLGEFSTQDGATKIKLSGDNIILEGDITANGKVNIDSSTGRLSADEATFTNVSLKSSELLDKSEKTGFTLKIDSNGLKSVKTYGDGSVSDFMQLGVVSTMFGTNEGYLPRLLFTNGYQTTDENVVCNTSLMYNNFIMSERRQATEFEGAAFYKVQITPQHIFFTRLLTQGENAGKEVTYALGIEDDGTKLILKQV